MGLDKFFNDLDKDDIRIPDNSYKYKVDKFVNRFDSSNFDLFKFEKSTIEKKVPMSMYFDKQDLALLKAIAYTKDTTVNKILMSVLKESLEITINSLPNDFNVETLAKKYDAKNVTWLKCIISTNFDRKKLHFGR